MGTSLDRVRQMPPGRRAVTLAVFGVSLLIVGAAERDLSSRSDAELRGPRALWRVVCLNALGALGYLTWGRRPAA